MFIACEVGPLQILEAIVALDEASEDDTGVSVDTAAAVDLPVVTAGPAGSIESSGNAMVDLLLEQPRTAQGSPSMPTKGSAFSTTSLT